MKKFDRSLNGYNISEVNAFVDDVVDKVDDMITKMKEKDLEIDRLNKELEHYKSMDATLNRAVVMAEEASNKYKENSLNESDLIVTEAKKNANRIINDALLKAEHIEEESARMRRNIVTYKRRIRTLLDEQSQIIDDLDKVDINE
ncbi:MAG TPA: DivIVA domain-containing protein [Bacilli bacterium]|jgi:cell division initiation protein|nr:DivIVA domain-containing protein [Bacilli bacterium]HPZ23370.1 DivIVA domain-containing protein [Bacilli bacterium]HQC83704.1 DivIVA domain-containing protein [Bacilli bacterium]